VLSQPNLTLGWLTLPVSGPLELIPAAAAAGFASVGLRVAPRPSDLKPAIAGDESLTRAVERSLKDHGVSVFEMGSIWLDGERDIEWCYPALETGARLGARYVIALVAPGMDPDRMLTDFIKLCRQAGALGLHVSIEFVRYLGVPTLQAADRLVIQSGQANAGILVDALHLSRSGGSASDLAAIEPSRIHFVQLCDAPLAAPAPDALAYEARNDRLDTGEGGLPLSDLMRALPPGTPLEVEVPHLAHKALAAGARAQRAGNATREFLLSID
jgi:sugar phosphate isomerase/epimerase